MHNMTVRGVVGVVTGGMVTGVIVGLCLSTAFRSAPVRAEVQENARWYRQTPARLDGTVIVEVFGDALTGKCYAVARITDALALLGEVPCR